MTVNKPNKTCAHLSGLLTVMFGIWAVKRVKASNRGNTEDLPLFHCYQDSLTWHIILLWNLYSCDWLANNTRCLYLSTQTTAIHKWCTGLHIAHTGILSLIFSFLSLYLHYFHFQVIYCMLPATIHWVYQHWATISNLHLPAIFNDFTTISEAKYFQ